jgi:hypothetical protein
MTLESQSWGQTLTHCSSPVKDFDHRPNDRGPTISMFDEFADLSYRFRLHWCRVGDRS